MKTTCAGVTPSGLLGVTYHFTTVSTYFCVGIGTPLGPRTNGRVAADDGTAATDIAAAGPTATDIAAAGPAAVDFAAAVPRRAYASAVISNGE